MSEIAGELIYYAHQLSKELTQLLLVPTSDVHYGNPLFSIDHFNDHIKFILDTPECYTVLNGDLCECVTKSSKGDIHKQVGTPQDQKDWIISKLLPIKDKILGMTTGNHEQRIYNESGFDVSKEIARELHIPYRPEGMLIKISFGDRNSSVEGRPFTYWVYMTHGYGGARTKSAKAVKVERVSTWIDADCYLMSHDHVVNIAPDIYLQPDPRTREDKDTGFLIGKVKAHRKILVKTNAFIKYGGYGEAGGFPPVCLETPIIKFAGTGEPNVKVEI